jgi:glycosyltransferase involved in cell wall biosynthesis
MKNGALFLIWEQLILPLILTIEKPEVYIATGGTSPWFLPKHTKQILWVHDVFFLENDIIKNQRFSFRQKLGQLYRRALLVKSIKNSQRVICISEFTKTRLTKILGYTVDLEVIYNSISSAGVDTVFTEKEKSFLIFTGPSYNKNPDFVHRLLTHFEKIDFGFHVTVLGLPRQLHVKNALFRYHEHLAAQDLQLLLTQSKYCIVPSIYEGFGLPPLEAIFYGCVPLVSKIDIFREIIPEFCLIDTDYPSSVSSIVDEIERNQSVIACNIEDVKNRIILNNENYKASLLQLITGL